MSEKFELKYHNDINKLKLGIFSEKETDIFFTLLLKAKNQSKFNITFKELREITEYKATTKQRLLNNILSLASKLKSLNQVIEISNGEFIIFSLFRDITISTNKNDMTLEIDERFKYMVEDILTHFTLIDLKELISLNSSYSKIAYRLLKQWESKKKRVFTVEEFREYLGVPKSYDTNNFNKKILAPILKELPTFFKGLKLEKIKTGNKVTSLNFTWNEKKEDVIEVEIIEITISEELNKNIIKAKKNIYINKFLKDEHIKKLLEIFEEKQLILGLDYAYKNIKEDFKKLIYLENSIRKGIENQKIKIVIIPSKPININIENEKKEVKIEFEQTVIKTKVTQKQYDNFYKEHLKKFNAEDNKFMKLAFDSSNHNKFEIIEEEKTIEFTEEQLLSKSGKKLVGGALEARKQKLIRELKKD